MLLRYPWSFFLGARERGSQLTPHFLPSPPGDQDEGGESQMDGWGRKGAFLVFLISRRDSWLYASHRILICSNNKMWAVQRKDGVFRPFWAKSQTRRGKNTIEDNPTRAWRLPFLAEMNICHRERGTAATSYPKCPKGSSILPSFLNGGTYCMYFAIFVCMWERCRCSTTLFIPHFSSSSLPRKRDRVRGRPGGTGYEEGKELERRSKEK